MNQFPSKYLQIKVSANTMAAKRKKGLCKHYKCMRKARAGATDCNTCHSRKIRLKNPHLYAYNQIKQSARKRNIPFELTLEEFMHWDERVGYLQSVGQGKGMQTIDRIDPSKGYSKDNIRLMEWHLNSSKLMDGISWPEDILAQALAKLTGKVVSSEIKEAAAQAGALFRQALDLEDLEGLLEVESDDGFIPF